MAVEPLNNAHKARIFSSHKQSTASFFPRENISAGTPRSNPTLKSASANTGTVWEKGSRLFSHALFTQRRGHVPRSAFPNQRSINTQQGHEGQRGFCSAHA